MSACPLADPQMTLLICFNSGKGCAQDEEREIMFTGHQLDQITGLFIVVINNGE